MDQLKRGRKRWTVEQRRESRNRNNVIRGKPPGWAEEALDFYLSGISPVEIIECFNVTNNVFYTAIAKAALYRLMVEHQAERLDEIPELTLKENQ